MTQKLQKDDNFKEKCKKAKLAPSLVGHKVLPKNSVVFLPFYLI